MKRFLQTGLIFAGVLGIAAAGSQADQDVTKNRKKFDLRETILRKFLRDNHCPDEQYTETFIAEADSHGLDWRLLPSLALVESGGGRTAKGNNLFGWANGKMAFSSISEAIHTVASALAHGKAYRNKDLDAKLATYNHGTDYRAMVRDIMNQISPRQQVEAAD
ncbi:MAG TPA: hypothetical protein VK789_04355 [Bryobacteraceae bacterium]|jgi:hypothetical protein|nr:hypothetical protein [Bryobacteraceae bacterium]